MNKVSENTGKPKRKARAKSMRGAVAKKSTTKTQRTTAKQQSATAAKKAPMAKQKAAPKQKAAKKKRDTVKKAGKEAKEKSKTKQHAATKTRAGKNQRISEKREQMLKRQPARVADYTDVVSRYPETFDKLMDIVDKLRSPRKDEIKRLINVFFEDLNTLSKHVPLDSIEIVDPHEVIDRIKQMEEEGLIKFETSKMARILLLSCVFESKVNVSQRLLSDWLKRR